MLQKEVGMRLVASSGTKAYGVLSILLGACASIERLMTIGPEHFHPKPKVDSVVVKIVFQPTPKEVSDLPEHDPALLKQIVKKSFQQRRKTLLNALSSAPFSTLNKEETKKFIISQGLSPAIRPDKLTITEYITLDNGLEELLNSRQAGV
jgi:16S rRNA (adenine1518-N6/adenine1519-N6)-dimethyltransferase